MDDGRTLFYDDVRRLGGFRLFEPSDWEEESDRLGPEPLGEAFRGEDLARIVGASRAPVKNILMDQRRLAGVGNIYASEALHRAGVDPRRPGRDLRTDAIRRLHRAVRRVLREALDSAGTTLRDYRAVDGRSGSFQASLRVYGREGERCRRCHGTIARVVQGGRSTFFCPSCQR